MFPVMGTSLRWLFAFLAALVLTAIFEPPLMAFFNSLGWHKPPSELAGDVVNWLAAITGEAAFPWLASGVLGASVGAWLHYAAANFDRKQPSKQRQFQDLSLLIENVRREWMEGLRDGSGNYDFSKTNYQSSLRLKALYAELRKVGLEPPDHDAAPPMEYNLGHYNYLQVLQPFADRGLLSEAKKEAAKANREFKDAARSSLLPPKIGGGTLY